MTSLCLSLCLLISIQLLNAAPHTNEDDDLKFDYDKTKTTCGYESCPATKPGVLNVHLISHTHDDVGWLKTVDQYYYGSNNTIQKAGVQYILDSVIDELHKDPSRRFIYVETAFFWKWWQRQNDNTRHKVQRLVREGRLEMIGGAWSMNDEATTNYQSIVDQFTWGLRKLNETFGECGRPRVGWQIDPFGHSREMANLLAGMGYDGLFLGRIDYQDKSQRFFAGQPEMIWRANDDLKEASDLFTGVLFNTYSPPPGFCFDILCSDQPIIDDPSSPDYNVDQKVDEFVKYALEESLVYQSNHITVTMGGDFTYMDSRTWFVNLDKLIQYVNWYGNLNGSKINVFYSTPSCYLKALHESKLKWPTKQDDFFPYASDPHAYWTGYFTSKPAIKYFERRGNNFLQVCKQLYSMTHLAEKDLIDLNALRTAMGIMQHHDAVTGTEKEHVAKDYERLLSIGMEDCLVPSKEALSNLIDPNYAEKQKDNSDQFPMKLCNWNMSECDVSERSNTFIVTVYNPLSHEVRKPVRLPVTGISYNVVDSEGLEVTTQIVPVPSAVLNIVNRNSNATNELVFIAENVPPLGFKNYYVSKLNSRSKRSITPQIIDSHSTENYITSNKLRLQLDSSDKSSLHRLDSSTRDTVDIAHSFLYYKGYYGNNEIFVNRSSGAYILRPNSSVPIDLGTPRNTVYKGPVVEEIHQYFNDWVSQVIRIYQNASFVEYEWTIGPIPIDDGIGKEVITRFSTNLNNSGVFYTDSNGRQMLKRLVNKRPTWEPTLLEPIAANYYPVTSRISIRDEAQNLQFSVLTDRAQGGSSLKDGQVEVMVHRRLLHDDAFGVDEPLNETRNGIGLVARGKHIVQFGPLKGSDIPQEAVDKIKTTEELLSPWVFISSADDILTFSQWKLLNNVHSGLSQSLPPNVHIMTLEPWRDSSLLLRLEHILEGSDDPGNLSGPVTVNLGELFKNLRLNSIRETTLGANKWLSDHNQMKWETSNSFADRFNDVYFLPVLPTGSDWRLERNDAEESKVSDEQNEPQSENPAQKEDINVSITLRPMEIRTFVITASKI